MLIDIIIKVKVSNRTKGFFIEKGYEEKDGFFHVSPDDMNKTNRTRVSCKCDYCGIINNIIWANYIKQIKKSNLYSCHKCHYNKSKIIFINKYGNEYPSKLDIIKDKIKETNLERYGTEWSLNSNEVKNKIKETNLERYGTEWAIASNIVREKTKETNLEKYKTYNVFCKNSTLRKDITERLKESLKDENVTEKRKRTILKKYGVDNIMKAEIFKQKSKETNIKKYGYEYPLQSIEVFNKVLSSNFKIKKYNNTEITYQGTYELDFLEKYYDKVNIEKIDPIMYKLNENKHYYHPDFYLPEFI
jgi:hypothetical protein